MSPSYLSIILASAAPQWVEAGKLPSPDEAVAQASSCQIEGITHAYDDEIQEDLVQIPDDANLSEKQLACLAEASFHTGYFIVVPQQYLAAYAVAGNDIALPWARERAHEWLSENGLLEGLQTFDPANMSDAEYAAMLEDRCGPVAHGALGSEFGPHSISPDWVMAFQSDYKRLGTAVACLFNSATFGGFELGLIGNEKGYISNPASPNEE